MCTDLPWREVWPFIESLQERGLIELEERGGNPATLRRLRVQNGGWTGWTQRKVAKLSHCAGVGDSGRSPETET